MYIIEAVSHPRRKGSAVFRSGSLHIDQPLGFLVGNARSLLGDVAVLIDVVQPLADLDKAHILVALDRGAVDAGCAALAIVALRQNQ